MKTIASAIAAIALIGGLSSSAEAREYYGRSYASSVYVSGHASCGTPIYTQRFLVRIDHHGHPVWGYRQLPLDYHGSRAGYGHGHHRGHYHRGHHGHGYHGRSHRHHHHDSRRDRVRHIIGELLR